MRTPPPRCMTQPARNAPEPACCPTKYPTTLAPGEESRHNLAYWRYLDYAGIGPGAHGRITIERRAAMPRGGIARPNRGPSGSSATAHGLTADEPVPTAGASAGGAADGSAAGGRHRPSGRFAARTGRRSRNRWTPRSSTRCIEEGYLDLTPDRLVATRKGGSGWIRCLRARADRWSEPKKRRCFWHRRSLGRKRPRKQCA